MMGRHQHETKLYYQLSVDQLVPPHHLLRQIADHIDFSFVYRLARPYYSDTGQPSIDPVVLFKMLLIGYLYGITSERRLMDEIGVNLAYRWLLGYDLDETIPDHSVLSKARGRFPLAVFEAFFDQTVELCKTAGLVRGEAVFMDSTLIQANASLSSLETREGHEPPLPAREYVRQVFRENPVSVDPPPDGPDVASSRPKGRKRAEKKIPANRQKRSRTDPEASLWNHPSFGVHLAYKAHVAVDDHPARVITAAVATPAAIVDEYMLEELLAQHARRTGALPRDVVADRRYGTMEIYRYLTGLGLRATIPDRSANKRGPAGVWSIRDFTYNPDQNTYTCAAGETLAPASVRPSERMTEYKAPPGVCADCRFRAECSPTGKRRGLRRSFDRSLIDDVQRWLDTDEGRQRYRQRQVYIETQFGIAKELHGLRRAKWRGRWRVQIQVWLTAAAMNMKKLVKSQGVTSGDLPTGQWPDRSFSPLLLAA
jgi:transposase